jgi:hypothetical protein
MLGVPKENLWISGPYKGVPYEVFEVLRDKTI